MPNVLRVMRKGRHVRTLYSRRYRAARTIQRRFRARRAYKSRFNSRVNRAIMSRDPQQYRLFSTDGYADVSQTPVVLLQLSNLKYNDANSNLKYCRTSPLIKVQNIHINMHVIAHDHPYNQVSIALVRHKRTPPIENADIQGLTGALTTEDDKPFLPSSNNTVTNQYPNHLGHLMTGTSLQAQPFVLNRMGWNPKVVDVIKTWNVICQPQAVNDTTAAGALNRIGVTYPILKEIDYFHKVNKTWKFENHTSRDSDTESFFPYNKQCYSIIAFSDSVAGLPSTHPQVCVSVRLAFKDKD